MGSLVLRERFLGQRVAERKRDGLGAKAESSFRKDPRDPLHTERWGPKTVGGVVVSGYPAGWLWSHTKGEAVSAALFGRVPGNGGSCPFYTSDTGLW